MTTEEEKTKPNFESGPPQCLKHLVKKGSSTLKGQIKRIFGNLLLNYKYVFALDEADLGKTHLVRHKIETVDHLLIINQSPRRIPLTKQTEMKI